MTTINLLNFEGRFDLLNVWKFKFALILRKNKLFRIADKSIAAIKLSLFNLSIVLEKWP